MQIDSAIQEIKTYSEDKLLSFASENIKDIYSVLRDYIIIQDDEIIVKATKIYVGFYINRSPIISIKLYKNSLTLWINERFTHIDDPQKIIKDVSNIGHHGVGECEIKVIDDSNIGYIQDILRKHIQKNIVKRRNLV